VGNIISLRIQGQRRKHISPFTVLFGRKTQIGIKKNSRKKTKNASNTPICIYFSVVDGRCECYLCKNKPRNATSESRDRCFGGEKDIVCPYLHEKNEIDILCCRAGGGTLRDQACRYVLC
jgi:hypothetical protein